MDDTISEMESDRIVLFGGNNHDKHELDCEEVTYEERVDDEYDQDDNKDVDDANLNDDDDDNDDNDDNDDSPPSLEELSCGIG